MRYSKAVGVICFFAVAMSLVSASAQLVIVEEHTFELSPFATPWELSLMVPYYDPAEYGGRPLEEVMVMLEGAADSSVDVTASGGDVTVLAGEVGAFITASGLIDSLTLDVLPKGIFAPPAINVPAGTTINLTDVSGFDMDFMVLAEPADVREFEGSGEYEVTLGSVGTSSITASGGNMDVSQRTESSAQLTVQYKVEAVPEPATLVILALGLVGLGWLRCR